MATNTPRTGLARALSKLGHCSRSQAGLLIRQGRISVNGTVKRDPEFPVRLGQDQVTIQGESVKEVERVYLMLNKPRGLVTTSQDEKGRETVYRCFDGMGFPHLPAVGRLDKASEGLLLFSNDTTWAAGITDPASHLDKTYHVQIAAIADEQLLQQLRRGVMDDGDHLAVKDVSILRQGEKNSWLEIILNEGRNRHIRRLLEALKIEVLRLMRVKIGQLELGSLAKGEWRRLTDSEIRKLGSFKSSKS